VYKVEDPPGRIPAADVGRPRRSLRRRDLLPDVPPDGGVVLAEKGLYPNVDFFAATVYHYLGIPPTCSPRWFSVSRMAGWTAHIMEQERRQRLIRPDSEYIGESGLTWIALDGPMRHSAPSETVAAQPRRGQAGPSGAGGGQQQVPYAIRDLRRGVALVWMRQSGQNVRGVRWR